MSVGFLSFTRREDAVMSRYLEKDNGIDAERISLIHVTASVETKAGIARPVRNI
jgi:hypothetical protein